MYTRPLHARRWAYSAATKLAGCALLLIFLTMMGCGQAGTAAGSDGPTPTATPPATPTPTLAPSPTPTPGKPVMIESLHMFDSMTGWAISSDRQHILRTTEGMQRWQDVTPTFNGKIYQINSSDFLDASHAWVALFPTSPQALQVLRTSDGGQTWQAANLPEQGTGVGSIDFINTQTGWLMLGKGAGMSHEAVDILHTSDGGATWSVISTTGTQGDQPGHIPFSGDKSGMSFSDASNGWVTGTIPMNNFVYLYKTSDGGVTWQHQAIAFTPGSNSQFGTQPPIFLSVSDGVLPVTIYLQNGTESIIYSTNNGGASWNATTPVAGFYSAASFVDMTHGWIVTSSNSTSALFATSDGGQHWSQYALPFTSANASIQQLDFVSSTTGWAVVARGANPNALWQTSNGGQSWAQVQPAL
jgi:photosystem II stability/assembly factor-like uncharacterized protein